ncbi:hypothetical protein AUTU_16110 [Aureibacter tunicatorum]|nr:hypothetical protein AUTU_16110 [Aureibacter tunicatorum]
MTWLVKHPPRTRANFYPDSLLKNKKLTTQIFETLGKTTVTISPVHPSNQTHIVWFHGGAYCLEALPTYWPLSETIISKINCKVSLLDYPLAPEFTYADTFNMLEKAYINLTEKFPEDDFIFLGDSAGGGLSLAFNQYIIKKSFHKLPVKNILVSPWLDLSLSNPDIDEQVKKDVILTKNMLNWAADKYSGANDKNIPMLSPIHGDIKSLPTIFISTSTDELFYPDNLKFMALLENNGKDYHPKISKKLPHDWLILPIPESRKLLLDIIEFIEKD